MRPVSRDILINLYITCGLSQREVARQLNTNNIRIKRLLIKYKIPLRKQYERRSGKNNSNWMGGEILTVQGHIKIRMPSHPRASKQGYVMRAILVWEETNGKPFPTGKEPHHDNEIPDDDRPENIIPLTHGEHTREHDLRRWKKKREEL